MAFYQGPAYLAPTGSTGNNTHNSVQVLAPAEVVVVEFIVEAAGATPTVTWKVQGAAENPEITDANSTWFDVPYITDATDTPAVAARTVTVVGKQVEFLDTDSGARFFRKLRLVTSANTNITYRGELFFVNHDS